jgi:uncharacterized membrane protein
VVSAVVLMVGAPFATGSGCADWATTSTVILAGSVLVTGAGMWYASIVISLRDAVLLFVLAFTFGWLAEVAGMRSDWLFGSTYAYHAGFNPKLPGAVPVAIPLAWYGIAGVPLLLLRRWQPGGSRRAGMAAKAAACAGYLAAVSFLFDQLGQAFGLWTFFREAAYLPGLNAKGWGLVGFAIAGCYLGMARDDATAAGRVTDRLEWIVVGACLLFHGWSVTAVATRLDSTWPALVATAGIAPHWLIWWRTRRLAPSGLARTPGVSQFVGDQVVERLPAANQADLVAVDEHLGG